MLLDGQDIYASDVDPMAIRRRIGMVFQRPNPFPTLSILDNTMAYGGRGLESPRRRWSTAERALRSAALWDEVKDKLQEQPAAAFRRSAAAALHRARHRRRARRAADGRADGVARSDRDAR